MLDNCVRRSNGSMCAYRCLELHFIVRVGMCLVMPFGNDACALARAVDRVFIDEPVGAFDGVGIPENFWLQSAVPLCVVGQRGRVLLQKAFAWRALWACGERCCCRQQSEEAQKSSEELHRVLYRVCL